MDYGYRFVSWSLIESKRLLLILGIAFAALLFVQLFKLPDDSVLSSLLSAGKVAFLGTVKDTYPSKIPNTTQVPNFMAHKNVALPPTSPSFGPTSTTNSEENMPLKSDITYLNNASYRTNPSPTYRTTTTTDTVSVARMDELLMESHSSINATPLPLFSAVDEELLNAKAEIESSHLIHHDLGLYEPIYRNVSKFKRSYKLMDKVLRVYIYKEGDKPIFHKSILEGIYASEGWFLKLLESNKKFVTEDHTKAHLFYFPFSSRLLELTLYVRHSHSRDNLITFIKNYVDMLIQKYPFWNRTNGQDHFLAACHDWAPAETRGKMLSSIRALCNADIKTGFVIGKDVSLPTVNVRSAKNPIKDIGGEPASNRSILAFFAGYMHGNVRPALLKHWGKDSEMRILDRMPHVKGNKNYIQYMKSSKYCICARGYAVHSPRVVESILFECVPVIIADNYVPPFFEVLNWKSFAVFILEEDIPDLKKILMSISEERYMELRKGVKQVQRHFLWHAEPVKYDLFHMVLHSVWYNRLSRIKSA